MLDYDVASIVYLSFICIFAGVIRGFTGIGFTMILLPLGSLFLPISVLVPSIMLLEVIGNGQMLPTMKRQVNWKWVIRTFIPCLLFTPLGVYLLKVLDQRTITMLICIFIIFSSIILLKGFQYKKSPGIGLQVFVGGITGLMNGSAAMSGPPAAAHALASRLTIESSRASLIAFILLADLCGFIFASINGLVSLPVILLCLLLYPTSLIGNKLGEYIFSKCGNANGRTAIITLLITIASLTMIHLYITSTGH